METKVKYCKFCNQDKLFKEFSKAKHCIFGISNKCKQCVHQYRMNYNKNNKEKILKYNLKFNQTYNIKWAKLNPHIIRWRDCIKSVIKYTGKLKKQKTFDILNYTHQQFKEHIEKQFTTGMDWSNIHIDHKIPLTWFKKSTPIKIINHLSNLQPLSPEQNISKLNRFAHEVDKEYLKLALPYLIPERINSFI